MNGQIKSANADLTHTIYTAFMEACKEQGGEAEPITNPWGELEFYQVLDLLANRAAKRIAQEKQS